MIFKRDSLKLGLILGFVGPLIGLVVIYFVKFPSYKFTEFLDTFIHENKLITSVGTLALLANALLFALYVNFDKFKTYKGIFIVTLIYGIGILVLKIFN